jgi:tRNA nucleotidyltransferase (CCA-adding enzyme)
MQLIISHEQSDFDAVAATLGAWLVNSEYVPVLQARLNRNVREFIHHYRHELPFIELGEIPAGPIQSVILVDTQSIPTLKGMSALTQVKVVDHHEKKVDLPEAWSSFSESTGSCTTLWVEHIKKAGVRLSVTQATLLLLGIYEDTGSLIYSYTTPRDIHAAGYLVEQKASLKIASHYLNPPLSDQQLDLYDQLLTHTQLHEVNGQRIIIAAADAENLKDEISSIAHKLRDFLDPDALLILVRTAEGIRLVARSTTDHVNVAALSSHFGGGGHERAAGALIRPKKTLPANQPMDLQSYIQEILSILPECIHPAVTVEQIMSHNPKILRPDTSAEKAAQLMARYGYEGYPVIEDSQVVGLLTRRLVDRSLAFNLNLSAGSLMEAGNYHVSTEDSIEDLQQLMTSSGWGQIPVIDPHSGKIIGIVTRTDLIKAISSRRGKNPPLRLHNLAARLDSFLPQGKLFLLKSIANLAQQQHLHLYIVGGFVRDLLLNRPVSDFDLVVEGDAITLGHKLVDMYGGRLVTHKQFGTAKWQINVIKSELSLHLQIQNPDDLPDSLDLISSRIEFYDRPSALPTIEHSSIKLDLHRRDFSINTLALRLDGAHFGDLYDYWGGMNDLRLGSIRVLHSLSFVDDPTRMLRAIRFEQRFNFKIETRTLRLMKEAHSLVESVSGDRLRHELDLFFLETNPSAILTRAGSLGLLSTLHPLLKWTAEDDQLLKKHLENPIPSYWNLKEQFHHTLTRVTLCYLLWFSRYSPQTGSAITKRLHFPGYLEEPLHDLWAIKPHLAGLASKKPSEIYSLLKGKTNIVLYCASLINPSEACCHVLQQFTTTWEHINPSVDGHTLQELNIKPGPIYTHIIDTLRNAWLDGLVTTHEEELQYLETIIKP